MRRATVMQLVLLWSIILPLWIGELEIRVMPCEVSLRVIVRLLLLLQLRWGLPRFVVTYDVSVKLRPWKGIILVDNGARRLIEVIRRFRAGAMNDDGQLDLYLLRVGVNDEDEPDLQNRGMI